jgi:hypothetical protein
LTSLQFKPLVADGSRVGREGWRQYEAPAILRREGKLNFLQRPPALPASARFVEAVAVPARA